MIMSVIIRKIEGRRVANKSQLPGLSRPSSAGSYKIGRGSVVGAEARELFRSGRMSAARTASPATESAVIMVKPDSHIPLAVRPRV